MAALSGGCRSFRDDDVNRAIDKACRLFGVTFKTEQRKALSSFLMGHDLFVSLPTGFGKSYVFQAAPICMDFIMANIMGTEEGVNKSLVSVVMPLKSLVSDQMSRANELHIAAADLTGGLTDTIREGIQSSSYSILFASPEILLGDDGRELFSMAVVRRQLCGLFIDESHCVSKWGNSSGDTKAFRSAYGKLGEVRSKMKSTVPVVAMTATATIEVRRSVVESLGLRNYVLLSRSPERSNIKHLFIKSKTKDFDAILRWMVEEVKENGIQTERTIIYCQSRKLVSNLYAMFMDLLPESDRKCVEMYHTNTETDVQQKIINSLGDMSGDVRVLVATIAYGMGVDLKGVHRTIICGRTSDLDDYIQMSGRIGRDGAQSVAVMLQYPGDIAGRSMSSSMKDFLRGDECRRVTIRKEFGEGESKSSVVAHNCCDICAVSCICNGASCSGEASSIEMALKRAVCTKGHAEELPLKIASPAQVTKLERALVEYRRSLLHEDEEHLYCGADISCGFSESVASQILKDCNVHFSFRAFVARYNFPSSKMSSDIWEILCSCLERVGLEEEDNSGYLSTEEESGGSYSESEYQEAHCSDIE